jgi:hypothetical protein
MVNTRHLVSVICIGTCRSLEFDYASENKVSGHPVILDINDDTNPFKSLKPISPQEISTIISHVFLFGGKTCTFTS